MARAMAREVGSRQITVNVVAPGVVETDMTAALGDGAAGRHDRPGSARAEPARRAMWPAWWASWPPTPPPTSPGL